MDSCEEKYPLQKPTARRERITLPVVTPALQDGQIAHQKRVQQLIDKIQSLGGEPSEGAGAWGAFANFLEGTAGLLGDKASVDMLEEGEDHGLQVYRDEIENCEDGDVRIFIMTSFAGAKKSRMKL